MQKWAAIPSLAFALLLFGLGGFKSDTIRILRQIPPSWYFIAAVVLVAAGFIILWQCSEIANKGRERRRMS